MIDIIFYIILILAVVQGWSKGLIVALFSLVCGLIGLAAAVKLSAVVATHMKSDLHINSRWLPVLAFILVFILVLLIIQWAGRLLEKMITWVLLGWLNKLGGILFYTLLYVAVYSVILFYGTRSGFISKQSIADSHLYTMIAPFGPEVIRLFTGLIPYGHDMFRTLEGFFDKIARGIQ